MLGASRAPVLPGGVRLSWLIYGANGYSGRLIAERAVACGHKPVLAGRREAAVAPIAGRLGLEHRVFGLDDPGAVAAGLADVVAVVHAAGPFSSTSRPMLDAAIRTGTHYLDITGEIDVFEAIFARNPEIDRAGIAAIPGVGFDVVPTDAIAAMLAEVLPTASRLELAFLGLSTVSPGTARTAVEGLPRGGVERVGGRLVPARFGRHQRQVRLGGKERALVSVPWGDVSTAYHATGIPNIVTYAALPDNLVRWLPLLRFARPLLSLAPVQNALQVQAERVEGPDAATRAREQSYVWGRAEDALGRWAEARLVTPEAYRFTAIAAVAAIDKLLGGCRRVGASTPSQAFGARFVTELEGVSLEAIERGERDHPSGAGAAL